MIISMFISTDFMITSPLKTVQAFPVFVGSKRFFKPCNSEVRKRERGKERKRKGERERERKCEKERKKEREEAQFGGET